MRKKDKAIRDIFLLIGGIIALMIGLFLITGCGTDPTLDVPKKPEPTPTYTPPGCKATPIAVSVTFPYGGVVIQCGTDPQVVVTNGATGNAGQPGGTVSFNLVQVIEPCGHASSPWKEVILGLQGGQFLSEFSGSSNATTTRFVFLPDGNYTDTDSSGCQFTVAGTKITWGAGTNAYSTWVAGGYQWSQANGWESL